MTYRFPLVDFDVNGERYRIPVLPEGDIFDTIPGAQEVEAVMARPSWDFAEADARLQPAVQKALAQRQAKAAGDRTKSKATPKRRPNRKVNP